MSTETKKIMDIIIETKSILDDFAKHLINMENRIKKIERQIA